MVNVYRAWLCDKITKRVKKTEMGQWIIGCVGLSIFSSDGDCVLSSEWLGYLKPDLSNRRAWHQIRFMPFEHSES